MTVRRIATSAVLLSLLPLIFRFNSPYLKNMLEMVSFGSHKNYAQQTRFSLHQSVTEDILYTKLRTTQYILGLAAESAGLMANEPSFRESSLSSSSGN